MDDPIPQELRARCVKVFEDLEDLRGLYFYRPRVPVDAQEPLVARLLVGADAGGDSMISGVWIGFKLQSGNWSCKHLIGKTLLPVKSWTIPMRELHSLWMNTALLRTTLNLLKEFFEDKLERKYVFGDSRISLAWTIYDGTRLLPFHRHRVTAITNEVPEEDRYHCPGNKNPADGGTKVKDITLEMVGPESIWENGLPWMTLNHEDMMSTLKSIDEIKLDDSQSKIVESAEALKPQFFTENKGFVVRLSSSEVANFKKRAEFSSYMEVLSPQKFRHTFVVRTYSYVMKFIMNMRRNVNRSRSKNQLPARTPLKMEVKRDIEYKVFFNHEAEMSDKNTKEEVFLSKFYGVTNVVIGKTRTYESSSNTKRFPNSPESWKPIGQPRYFPHQAPGNEVQLSEEDLSRDLAFIFTSTTAEVIEYNDKTWVKKKCILKEKFLFAEEELWKDKR